jgi:hypothetical protein
MVGGRVSPFSHSHSHPHVSHYISRNPFFLTSRARQPSHPTARRLPLPFRPPLPPPAPALPLTTFPPPSPRPAPPSWHRSTTHAPIPHVLRQRHGGLHCAKHVPARACRFYSAIPRRHSCCLLRALAGKGRVVLYLLVWDGRAGRLALAVVLCCLVRVW